MKFNQLFWLGLTLLAFGAAAQLVDDPDWKESEAPPPPAFNSKQLIAIDMPRYVTLKFGVDPATLSITPEGIVRYVMVATNASGSVNAMYEGIRCASGEVKTYARYSPSGHWSAVKNPPWQALNDNLPSLHAMALARQGACQGRSTPGNSVADIVKALKSPMPY
ncbi:MAG TPA: CNP1-like family protein [Rhodoferax sp.]